jgi:hypothetical protein
MKKKGVAPSGRAKPRPTVRKTPTRQAVTPTTAAVAPPPDLTYAFQVCMECPRGMYFLSSLKVRMSTLRIRIVAQSTISQFRIVARIGMRFLAHFFDLLNDNVR